VPPGVLRDLMLDELISRRIALGEINEGFAAAFFVVVRIIFSGSARSPD
jgi:hypothetical protein